MSEIKTVAQAAEAIEALRAETAANAEALARIEAVLTAGDDLAADAAQQQSRTLGQLDTFVGEWPPDLATSETIVQTLVRIQGLVTGLARRLNSQQGVGSQSPVGGLTAAQPSRS